MIFVVIVYCDAPKLFLIYDEFQKLLKFLLKTKLFTPTQNSIDEYDRMRNLQALINFITGRKSYRSYHLQILKKIITNNQKILLR